MGRYDFAPRRVQRSAAALFASNRLNTLPVWHDAVQSIPPAEILTRPVLQRSGKRRRSRMFKPMELKYPEDELRQDFFGDHPWELARPKVILENTGNDAKHWDWKNIVQPGKKLDGESVVQRQLWLMEHQGLDKAHAYDKARKEFYRYRHLEDVERRVAKEEAEATGAYFGKGPNEIGMELEKKAWDNWREWAAEQIKQEEFARGAQAGAVGVGAPRDTEEAEVDDPLEEVELVGEETS